MYCNLCEYACTHAAFKQLQPKPVASFAACTPPNSPKSASIFQTVRLPHLSISQPSETFGARSFKNSSNLRSLATYATCDLMNRFGEPSQVPNQIDTGELPTKFIQRVLSWIPWVFPYLGK